jgi:hypothetical protein
MLKKICGFTVFFFFFIKIYLQTKKIDCNLILIRRRRRSRKKRKKSVKNEIDIKKRLCEKKNIGICLVAKRKNSC